MKVKLDVPFAFINGKKHPSRKLHSRNPSCFMEFYRNSWVASKILFAHPHCRSDFTFKLFRKSNSCGACEMSRPDVSSALQQNVIIGKSNISGLFVTFTWVSARKAYKNTKLIQFCLEDPKVVSSASSMAQSWNIEHNSSSLSSNQHQFSSPWFRFFSWGCPVLPFSIFLSLVHSN